MSRRGYIRKTVTVPEGHKAIIISDAFFFEVFKPMLRRAIRESLDSKYKRPKPRTTQK